MQINLFGILFFYKKTKIQGEDGKKPVMIKKKIVSISFVAKEINIRTQLDALQNMKSAIHKKNKETGSKFTVKIGSYKLSELLAAGSNNQ